MVTKYDVLKYLKSTDSNVINKYFKLSEDEISIIDAETKNILCTVDDFVALIRKETHCDFDCIYTEDASLDNILCCNECGTVIFSGNDERYDPNLKCPTCSDYKPNCKYWTAEEIKSDPNKQQIITMYKKMTDYRIAAEKRRKDRGGLNDWEIFKYNLKLKNSKFAISLECNDLFESGLKGLHLHIGKYIKCEDELCYIGKWFKRIPLSLYAIYTYWILPHTKKYKELFNNTIK